MKAVVSPSAAPAKRRGGVGRAAWLSQQKGRKAVLYVVKLYGNEGEPPFYKVGITFCLTQRFSRLRFVGYKWRSIARFSSYDAGQVYDLEANLHSAGFAPYVPFLSFAGHGECYADAGDILAALPAGMFVLKNNDTLI